MSQVDYRTLNAEHFPPLRTTFRIPHSISPLFRSEGSHGSCRQPGKTGARAASVVTRYGIRLLPEPFEYLNPMPYKAAANLEVDLAEDLRGAGYTVTGGH